MNTTYNKVYTFFKLLNLDTNEIPAIYKTVQDVLNRRDENAVNLVTEYTAKACQSMILAQDSRAFDFEVETKTLDSIQEHPIYSGTIAQFEDEFIEKFNQLSMPARFVLWIQSVSTLKNEDIAHILKMKEFEVCALEQEILSFFEPTVFDYFKQYASSKQMPDSLLTKVTSYTKTNRSKTAKNYFFLAAVIVIILCGAYYYYGNYKSLKDPQQQISISEDEVYYANIKIKDYGTIEVCLDQTEAPITVDNFVKLAKSGFYDGLTFHRIIDGFMIQGGDPNGNGTGGSEQTIVGEFESNGYENNIRHVRGTISMARSQDKNSASSQFFIMHKDSPHLDGEYAAFGTVTKGMDVVDAIVKDAKPTDGNGSIPRESQPVIESIEIFTE